MKSIAGKLRSGRAGITLIETVTSIGALVAVLAVIFSVVAITLRATEAATSQLTRSAALGRLARTFRDDVRAALAVSAEGGPSGWAGQLILTLPGERQVEYRVADGRLFVERKHEGRRTSRDELSLSRLSRAVGSTMAATTNGTTPAPVRPQGLAIGFRITGIGTGDLVSLVVAEEHADSPRPQWVISAARGADLRFDRTSSKARPKEDR